MGKRGRPRGAVDKSRDYAGAVAKMRALIASGASDREAARVIGEELRIPASTLRKHLAKKPKTGLRLAVEFPLSSLEVRPRLSAEEIDRRTEARRRELEESLPPLTEKEKRRLAQQEKNRKQIETMRILGLFGPSPSPPKKKR